MKHTTLAAAHACAFSVAAAMPALTLKAIWDEINDALEAGRDCAEFLARSREALAATPVPTPERSS